MAQSDRGRIELFYDFFSEDNIANTAETRQLGPFLVGGQGSAEADAGVPSISGVLSGAGRITTTNEDNHTTLVGTNIAFDVGLMGPLVAEARVQLDNLDTKEVFFGFTDIDPNTLSIETDVMTGGTATLTLTASDICGFFLSAELTDDEDWHMVYNGGTTTGETTSTSVDADDDAVAGEWQVLRLEIDTNGTARWYIDGVLKQTKTGAASTSVNMALILGVEAKGAAIENLDVDYLLVQANRDWTV
jgi:hypothetical protein